MSLVQRIVVLIAAVVGILPAIFFALIELGLAQAQANPIGNDTTPGSIDRYVDNVAFGVGEKLEFDINYGFINAGSATMEVVKLVEYDSRPAYQVVSRAQSNNFFSTFYRVDDRVETIIDAVGVFSWHFDKRLQEGKYRAERSYSFNQQENYTVYKGDTIDVEPFVQDALSTLYYIRTQDLKVGESVSVHTFIDGKKHAMEVKVHERERISVEAGTFDCLVVEPLAAETGVFKHEGRLKVWLTDDRLRMPVQMKSKLVVGSITAELTGFTLGELAEF